jgi:predicted nuclease with TOPRIM domain
MIYDNLSNEELLKEVYLNQHTNRLLTLVCERLEMVMRELADVPKPDEFEDEIDNLRSEVNRLEGVLAASDDEIFTLNKKIDDLETTLDSLTDDPEF